MEQIVVGMADCRIGDAPGQVLTTYALGSCIGLVVHDPKAGCGRTAAFHASRFRHRSRPRAANIPYMFADTGIPLLLESGLRAGRVQAAPGRSCHRRRTDDGSPECV